MKKFLFIFMLLIFSVSSSFAQSKLNLSLEGQSAYETLLKADKVSFGMVGYAATPTQLYGAYRTLLAEKENVNAFRLLLDKATPAGQTYALLGLKEKNLKEFQKAVKRYQNNSELNERVKVEVGGGCDMRFNYSEKTILQVVGVEESVVTGKTVQEKSSEANTLSGVFNYFYE